MENCGYSRILSDNEDDSIRTAEEPGPGESQTGFEGADPDTIMSKNWDKFVLLMWKNWVLQYRKPVQTIIEILAPVLFSILLVVIRSLVDPKNHDGVVFDSFEIVPRQMITRLPLMVAAGPATNYTLLYTPQNSIADKIINDRFSMLFFVNGFNNSEDLDYYLASNQSKSTFAAIQFDDDLPKDLPKDLNVKIRFPGELRVGDDIFGENNWKTNLIYPLFQTPGPRNYTSQYGATPGYFLEGFLTLQYLVSLSVFCINENTIPDFGTCAENYHVKMQRFPYGKWQEDVLLQPLISFVGIIIMLSFVYTCINTTKTITTEKEKQLKEAMKIMGLSNWLHWTAWFLKTFIFLFISSILIVVLLKVKWYPNTDCSVFTHADPSVMLVFLLFYMSATVTFCFAVSVFFSKANTAATISGLCWFLSYAPYLFLQDQYDSTSLSTKLLSSLGANTAMAYGFQLMLMYEGTGEGIQWNNVGKPSTPDDDLTLGLVMVMLAVDTVIYLLIALYFEAIFPGEYGVPQPWYFPFTSNFWCGTPRYKGVEDFFTHDSQQGEFFEKEPTNLPVGIKIHNLRKVFSNKAAVRNLSLNMYENQITVLLGHNGAGKTTTMSMLTGMFPPTSGTAVVGGYDIKTNMENVRDSLGLCPQHNIIFDDMTVSEHLYFFSKLKGLNGKEIDKEITKYVNLLELVPKINAKSSTLSGGMKRKLCVGMALCGNSKVVMLDEPTAGMDPSARRALWNLLQSQKDGRTMLLTTHFMDEADLLGDRIAIMAGGELQCCGSSFFLKKKYGAGYSLIMDKAPHCDAIAVTQFLRKHIPNIEIHSNIGSELSYLLVENQSSVFEQMLCDLEEHSQALGINSYGISLTTLEEVFMKVGADHGQEEMYNANGKAHTNDVSINHKVVEETKLHVEQTVLLTGFQLIINQFLAMFMKRVLSTWRSWILQLIQIAMPVIFLIIAIIVSRNANRSGDLPSMDLSLDKYDNPITIYSDPTNQYINTYGNTIKKLGYEASNQDNITDFMIDKSTTTPATVRRKYIIGASVEAPDTLVAWFNNDPYHSPGVALGQVLDAIYKTINDQDFTLSFENYPLPFTTTTKINQLLKGNSMGFQLAFNIGFSMAFVSSFYVLFYVRERVCKSKHLQYVSGVKVYIFWITSILCDLICYFVTIIALLITLVSFQEDGFKTGEDIGRMFLILLFFGWSILPVMYFAAFFFEVPSTGYTRMTLFSIFTGNAAFMVIQILGTPGFDLEHVANGMHWIFLIVPHYSLSTAIRDSYTTFAYNNICEFIYKACAMQGIPKDDCFAMNNLTATCAVGTDYFQWKSPGIGRNLLYSFTLGPILFLALLLKEYKVFNFISDAITRKYFQKHPVENIGEDEDVANERRVIENTPEYQLNNNYTLVLKDVTKYYKNFLAVNSLCLGVKKYECFGLLGVNGAGKTTTFKMMTGDEKISYGNAWVNGLNLSKSLKQVQKLIGYCPQFDALLDDLTTRESLTMFALLRGVPFNECNYLATKLARNFDFTRHLDKKVKELSGGNKRKLSTAISLIGDPPVMYLDEPTTGMDPATKRFLWNTLCQVRDSGKCVILTSHSMEECEALCTRLAIMVNGNFMCLGSTQHLKNKFAEGYTLTIKVRKEDDGDQSQVMQRIDDFMERSFPGAQLRERHQELLNYYITDKTVPWSRMFGILEAAKRGGDLNIEDYSLGQCSLEQVFLTFTKNQR